MRPTMKNRRVLLASRPMGLPTSANFVFDEQIVPAIGPGEILLKTLWLSIEPYMLLGMKGSAPHSRRPGPDRLANLAGKYLGGVEIGAVMYGPTVSLVVESRNERFSAGDVVQAYSGWQHYAIDDGSTLRKIDTAQLSPTTALGVLGVPGFTAYIGMKLIGQPKPGETVAVSAALGPVGSVVGQMARIAGARAVGIASGPEKCRYLVEELRFDAAVDRLADDFPEQLKAACPKGIDVYFENAGGAVWWAALPLLNEFARVPLCGLVANYSDGGTVAGVDRSMEVLQKILLFRIRIQGLFTFDHSNMEDEFLKDVGAWVSEGRIRYKEDIVDGLDHAPEALIGVLKGRNVGKLLVKTGDM